MLKKSKNKIRMTKSPKLIYPSEGGTLYSCDYVVNDRSIKRLIISNHYKKKHSKYMNDELIIRFVENYLDGEKFKEGKKKNSWEYFDLEPILYQEKRYKLVWAFHEDVPDFLGIVNCCYSNVKKNDYEKER